MNIQIICIGKLKNKPGYVVALGGTDLINAEENLGIKEDLLSAFNKCNWASDYVHR